MLNVYQRSWVGLVSLLCFLIFGQSAAMGQCPSARSGKGPVIYPGGVMFRVWAPNAESVNVSGPFNNWSSSAHPLCSEGTGYWSADIAGVTNGTQYKFVIRRAGATLWQRDPRGRAVVNSVGNSIVADAQAYVWQDAASTLPNWNETVIYEMHVGTFNDPTPTNNVPANFYDAAQKLDHLVELGVNMVELLPVNEFPGDYSWGYNPSEVFAVESVYGGVNALRHFVNEAHKRNIGVILDVVYNHLGPNDLSLWQFDGWSTGGYGGIYFYQDARVNTPWGNTRPDYGRAEVRWFLQDAVMMWLDECHIDGFRWDATAYIRNVYGNDNDPANDLNDGWGMMMEANNRLDAAAPWAISIAEDMKGNPWLTKTTGEGGAGFDSQWDPGFVHPVRAAINDGSDANRSMFAVRDSIVRKENNDAFKRVIYTESHDEVANGKQRNPSTIDLANPGSFFARKRSTLGAGILLTSPGIPMLFQGQEILEDEWFRDTDPVDWSKKTTYNGVFRLYKDLIALRKNATGATRGLTGQNVNVFHVNDGNKVIAYHRWMNGGAGDDVVVVANFANTTWPASSNYRIGFPQGGTWYVHFNSDATIYGSDYSNIGGQTVNAEAVAYNGLGFSGTIAMGPYSVLVLSQGSGTAPVDQPPSAGLTAPASGATVSGSVTISAAAQDDLGVAEVRFYVGGTLVATDTTAPYSTAWNSTSVSNGAYTVQATAVDTIGQTASDSLSINVNNVTDMPPTVSITSPAAGSSVSGTVSIAATATDDLGVASVKFYIDGTLVSTDTTSPYSHSWNTTTATNGSHSLRTVAQDSAGHSTTQTIAVTVGNPVGFLSSYSSMTLAGSFNGWNPALNNMTLISNHTWQVVINLSVGSGAQFKFAANSGWTANWGETNQSDTTVNMSGTAEALGNNIRSSKSMSGNHRFRFNELTRSYSVTKL